MAVDPSSQPATAVEALETLGRLSLRQLSMEELLQTVARLAGSVLPGAPETSVTLLDRGRPTTVVHTGPLALELDETQYEQDEGPCLHAARSGEVTEIADTRTDARWPDYARRAVDRGSLSSLSVPLRVDEDVTGALNVYARRAEAFDDAARAAGAGFGSYAAIAAGNLYAYRRARSEADNLQAALESRGVIDQAKGILMERYRLTADQAFQLLTRASMGANRKVRDIADQLVHTGELPVTLPGAGGRRPRPPSGRPTPRAPGDS
ncbi:GAF and ANTAR domain-containing protein [Geodermatophilus sp. DSM 44513]|uniref:ANTAR domain-containing protein n=1 Tax=Geodermatophilus sp. DSM 44513 TaxID=1528104 RepID=UPI00126CCBB1|nr:GAF and ANTAR domain-containing protein [Geodermatophilus sp. DSM 44513]WNV75557.1 GAF and ANTAR domain-containing protein [Geodermatophilus sp. DSM 44513]